MGAKVNQNSFLLENDFQLHLDLRQVYDLGCINQVDH